MWPVSFQVSVEGRRYLGFEVSHPGQFISSIPGGLGIELEGAKTTILGLGRASELLYGWATWSGPGGVLGPMV